MRRTGKPSGDTQIRRHIAGLIAFLFAVVSLLASQHDHRQNLVPGSGVTFTASGVGFTSPTMNDTGSADPRYPSFSKADCAVCLWLATGRTAPGVAATVTATAFSAVTILLLSVRLAALCAVPAPRRGLRAPPHVSFA